MAYPTVSSPYGLLAVNRIDGMPYAGAIRQIPVETNYATNIGFGDPVQIDAGYVVKTTSGSAGTPCGVCVGAQYVNSSGQTVRGQYYPAGLATSTNPAYIYVVDDPMALFKAAVVTSGTTVTTTGVSRAVVGSNMELVINTTNTTTGDSRTGILEGSEVVTATVPVRVIDVVPATAIGADAYVELLVKINTHQYNNTTGVV